MNTFTFTVTGRLGFPADMLRYDRAQPISAEEADRLDYYHAHPNRWALGPVSFRLSSPIEPTPDRWASFGWACQPD